jgi:hypothetical protein
VLPLGQADGEAPPAALRGKRVAVVQSNYIPWKGYFDLIAGVDVFVLYDDAQYTRRDWRNRNRIKTAQGVQWLTVPVQVTGKYHQLIREVVVSDPGWAAAHWRTLIHHYGKAAGFTEVAPALEGLYRDVAATQRLSEINYHFLTGINKLLGIATPLKWSSELELTGDRTQRLLGMCRQLGAVTYVSGPTARGYLEERLFQDAGIGVEWADYSAYPEYRQLHPPFDHHVSIVDLLLNEGTAARRFLKHA